jgi:tetratricopeptide (TPR) repeat protein
MSSARTVNLRRSERSTLSSLILGAALVLAAPRAALADDTASGRDADHKNQAQAKYEQGVELYRNQRYADAIQLFLAADALWPSAALSFNIARAYEKLADDAATLRWYRNYLRLNPEAPNAAQVRQSIQTLSLALARKGIQQLTVLSTPVGATVAIDAQALGVTPLTIELKPGAHHALVTLRGFADQQRDFTLSAPTALDLSFELQPSRSEAPPLTGTAPDAAASARHDHARRLGVAPFITLGVGAVALGGAAFFEVRRRSAQNAARDDQTQLATEDDVNAMNSRQTTARVLLGVGSVLVATGATLLWFDTRQSTRSTATTVTVAPGAAALWVTRSF